MPKLVVKIARRKKINRKKFSSTVLRPKSPPTSRIEFAKAGFLGRISLTFRS